MKAKFASLVYDLAKSHPCRLAHGAQQNLEDFHSYYIYSLYIRPSGHKPPTRRPSVSNFGGEPHLPSFEHLPPEQSGPFRWQNHPSNGDHDLLRHLGYTHNQNLPYLDTFRVFASGYLRWEDRKDYDECSRVFAMHYTIYT